MTEPMSRVEIATDGACKGNPGPGGWGALLRFGSHEKELSGGEPMTTNNRMELTAAIRALQAVKEPSSVTFITDSTYLQKGITEWMTGWLAKNWRGSNGPVLNQDLWKELLQAEKPHEVTWHWVKGHAGNRWNTRVDWLVRQARKNG